MAFPDIIPTGKRVPSSKEKKNEGERLTREFVKPEKPLPSRRKKEVETPGSAEAESQQLWGFLQENRAGLEERVEPLVHLRFGKPMPTSYNTDHLPFLVINRDSAENQLLVMRENETSASKKMKYETALQLLRQQKELMQQYLVARYKVRSEAARGTSVLKSSDLETIPEPDVPPPMPAVARKIEGGLSLEENEQQEAEELWTRLGRLRDELARIDIDDVDALEFKGTLPTQFTPSIQGLNCVNFNEVYEKLEGNKKYSYETGVMRRYKVLYDRLYQLVGKMKRGRPLTEPQPIPVIGVGRKKPMERTESMLDSARRMNVAASIRYGRAQAEARIVAKAAAAAAQRKDFDDSFDFMKTPRRSPETSLEKAEMLYSEIQLKRESLEEDVRVGGLPGVKFKNEGLLQGQETPLQFTGGTEGLEIDMRQTEFLLDRMSDAKRRAATEKIQEYLRMLRDYKNFVKEMRGDDEEKPTEPVDRKSPPVRRKSPPIARDFAPMVPEMDEITPGKFDTKINPEQPKRIWEELKALRDSLEQVSLGFGKTITFYGELPDSYDGGNEGLTMKDPEKVLETLKKKGMKDGLNDAKNYFLLMEEYNRIATPKSKNKKELSWWKAGRRGEYEADESPLLKVLEMTACSGLSSQEKKLIMENGTFRDAFRKVSADVSFDMLSETKSVNVKLSQLVMRAARVAVNQLQDSLRKEGFKVDRNGEPTLLTRWFQKAMVNSDRYREYKAMFDLHTALDRDHMNNFNAVQKNAGKIG